MSAETGLCPRTHVLRYRKRSSDTKNCFQENMNSEKYLKNEDEMPMENENRNPDEDKVPEEFKEPEPYAIYKEALSHLEGFTSSSPKTTNSLVESIRQNLEKNPGEVYNILKRASKNELSPIASRKGRGGGYYLAPIQSRSEKAESTVDLQAEAEKSARTLERHLWPLINLWLREEKEIQNTSYKIAHKKGGGTWGNPDVVALRP